MSHRLDDDPRADVGRHPYPSTLPIRDPSAPGPLQHDPSSHTLKVIAVAPSLTALPTPGHQVGDYLLVEELARGGMGVIYKAHQLSLDRTVALKMVLHGEFAQPGEVARFRSEARAIAHLHHPHLVGIFEVGEHRGLPFYAMEFLPGGPLSRRLNGRPLEPRDAARLLLPLAEAIDFAHTRGIIHRDLKPSNILLGDDAPLGTGVAKVTDFGVAKRLNDRSDLTRTGEVLGTPGYMAPEQAAGDLVGPAADVYSLGAILHEALTGRAPFAGPDPAATLLRLLHHEVGSPRAVNPLIPLDLETICLKCLEKDPAKRYASAAALAEDLRRYLAGEPILARPATAIERARRWLRRNPVKATAAAAAVLLAAVGFAAMVSSWRQAEARAGLEAEMRTVKEKNLVEVRALLADALLERGIAMAQKHDVSRGLHWILRSLEVAEEVGDRRPQARALAEAARYNLAHWGEHASRQPVELRHRMWAWDVGFSPDGRFAVTACKDTHVRVWDAGTGALVGTPLPHGGPVWSVRYHPSGKYLFSAAGGEAGEVRVHRADPTTGAFVRLGDPADTPQPVNRLLVSADGSALCAVQRGGPPRLYSFDPSAEPALKLVASLGDEAGVAACFSPDSRTLYYATVNGTVAACNAADGAEARTPWRLGMQPTALAGCPDGATLAVATLDPVERRTAVHVWDLRSDERHLQALETNGPVKLMTFSPCGRRLAVSVVRKEGEEYRGHLRLLEVETPFALSEVYAPIEHPRPVWSVAFHPAGQLLITGSEDRQSRLFEVATGRLLAPPYTHGGNVTNVAISADGRRAITACSGAGDENDRAAIHDLPRLGLAPTRFTPPRPLADVQWTRDGKGLFSLDPQGTVHHLDPDGRSVRTVLPADQGSNRQFGPRGLLRVLGPTKRMSLTDLEAGRTVFEGNQPLHTHDAHGTQVAGRVIVYDRPAKRLNLHPLAGRPGPTVSVPVEDAMTYIFAHDGPPAFGVPVFGGTMPIEIRGEGGRPARDGALVRIWDMNGKLLRSWTFPFGVAAASLTPKGDLLGVFAANQARFLDVASGEPVGTGINFEKHPLRVCYHPTEDIVLLGDLHGVVSRWHIPTARPIGRSIHAAEGLPFLAARPDGAGYLTGSGKRRALWLPHVGPKAGSVGQLREWVEGLTGMTREEAEARVTGIR